MYKRSNLVSIEIATHTLTYQSHGEIPTCLASLTNSAPFDILVLVNRKRSYAKP